MKKLIGSLVVLATCSTMCCAQQPLNIIIRSDDPVNSQTLAEFATDLGNFASGVDTADELSTMLADADQKVDILITGMATLGENGVEFLQSLHKKYPKLAVILITNGLSVLSASEAKSCGVHYFLREPIQLSELELFLSRYSEIQEELAQKKNSNKRRPKVLFASWPFAVPTTYAKSGTANMHRCCERKPRKWIDFCISVNAHEFV